MDKIVELFQRKDQIKTLGEKVLWREELLCWIERKRTYDPLLDEIVDILYILTSEDETSHLESELLEKFNLFLKYLKKRKTFLQKNLLALINSAEEYLSDKHKVSVLGQDFFCSDELSNWATETYYLMFKLQNKIEFTENIWWLVRKARGVITKEQKITLQKYLKDFRLNTLVAK